MTGAKLARSINSTYLTNGQIKSESVCGVKGCVFIGHWAAGAMCPEHRNNPLTDKTHQRNPTLSEAFESIDTDGAGQP